MIWTAFILSGVALAVSGISLFMVCTIKSPASEMDYDRDAGNFRRAVIRESGGYQPLYSGPPSTPPNAGSSVERL